MKSKITIIVVVAIIILTFIAGAAFSQQSDFEKSPGFKKLDGRARQAWLAAMKKGDTKKELDCLIKVEKKLTPDQKGKLIGAGYAAGSIIETIVTGKAPVGKVPAIAALDFVKVIELAVPLSPKEKVAAQPTAKKPPAVAPSPTPEAKPKETAKTTEKAAQTPTQATTTKSAPKPQQVIQLTPPSVPIYQEQVTPPPTTPPAPVADYPDHPPTSDNIPTGSPSVLPENGAVTEVRPVVTPATRKEEVAPEPPVSPTAIPLPQATTPQPVAPAQPAPNAPKSPYAPAQ